jgi:TetR/AcrR family transcriptional regulator, transcriptional repressor of aconitase
LPKVTQAHLDARRQQIIDAARSLFAAQGFARTSMTDLVGASGLSIGAIYRYFRSKDEIIAAICDQAGGSLPTVLDAETITCFLEQIRRLSREDGHARLIAQIYAEAAIDPRLAEVVQHQVQELRGEVAARLTGRSPEQAESIAEAFVALAHGYTQQLAIRGDLDPAPFVTGLVGILDS